MTAEAMGENLRFLPKLEATRPEELVHLVMAPVPVDELVCAGWAFHSLRIAKSNVTLTLTLLCTWLAPVA